MGDNYREVRNRYRDAVRGEHQDPFVRDIGVLLRYIDGLHEQLAQQVTEQALQSVVASWEEDERGLPH